MYTAKNHRPETNETKHTSTDTHTHTVTHRHTHIHTQTHINTHIHTNTHTHTHTYNLRLTHKNIKENAKAVNSYSKALENPPEIEDVHYRLVMLLSRTRHLT